MKKMIFKNMIGSVLLLFCVSNLQAQYTVHEVKGTVEMSVDGKTWKPAKEKDKLNGDYQIKMLKNSSVHITDKNDWVYSYADTKTVSVSDIVKQRKTVLETMNESSGKRTATLVVDRYGIGGDTCKVCLYFKVAGKSKWYDLNKIPTGSVFYITIFNKTETDKIVNVYQELENKELIPCLPENIHLEKETAIEFIDILFVKQENNKFIVITNEK